MSRFRYAAALLALVVWSGVAAAADPPLEQFSGDTDVLIRIKAPKATIEKVATLIDKVQPGFGAMVRQNSVAFGQLVSNPTLAGVNQNQDWYIGVFTQGEEEPHVVFAVPTTDAEAAKAAIGEDLSSKAVGDWLFYSESADSLPGDSAPEQTIAAVMRGESSKVFDRGDVSVFVNIAHLTTAYADQIAMGQEQLGTVIDQIGTQMPQTPGMDMTAVLDIYKQLFEQVFQAVEDGQQLTVVVNIADDGIVLEDYLTFTPSSETATALANQPRSEMKNAAKLPADAVMIFGASADMAGMMQWGMQFTGKMFGENEQLKKAAEQVEEAAKGVKFGSIVGSFSLGSAEQGIVRYVLVTEVNPADKWREASREIAKSTGKIELPGFTQETTLEADAERIGDAIADVVTIKQEFDENADPGGMQKQMQQMMFGPDGMKSYIVYQTDKMVQTMGGGKELMADALKGLKSSGPVQPPAFRKGLIADPNFLFLIDVPGLAVQGLKAASAIPGLPIQVDAKALDDIKLEKSYIGFSAAVEENAVRAKTRVPVQQVQSMMAVGMFFQQMQQQQFRGN